MTGFQDLSHAGLFAVATMLAGNPALACEILSTDGAKPAITGPDGSYFAQSDHSFVEGRPVIDIGNGRVGQRLRMAQSCVETEQLVFADCSTGEMVVIDGTISPEQTRTQRDAPPTIFFFDTSVRFLQPPYGPIGLTPTSSVREIATKADAAGFENSLSSEAAFAGYEIGAAFDPFFGCKLFYPDSAGARN
jgi:hypothetical protein